MRNVCEMGGKVAAIKIRDGTELLVELGRSLQNQDEKGLESLTSQLKILSRFIGSDYCCIAELLPGSKTVRSLVFLKDGEVSENQEVLLKDTPCETLTPEEVCQIPSGVQQQFSKDSRLVQMGIEGYLGAVILVEKGVPIGVLSALYKHPIKAPDEKAQILKVFSKLIEEEFSLLVKHGLPCSLAEQAKCPLNTKHPSEDILWRNFLESTLDNMPAIFYAKSKDGRFIHVNQEFLKPFRFEREEVIGKTNHEIFPVEVADLFRKTDLETMKQKTATVTEEVAIDHDGDKRFYRSYKFPYIDENGEAYATGGISIDITSAKRAEEALEVERSKSMQNAKLASLGELAAGVAHEINNPLTIILGSAQLMKRYIQSGDNKAILKNSEVIIETVRRISKIVMGLRVYARDSSKEKFEIRTAHHLVQLSTDLLGEYFRHSGIEIKLRGNLNLELEVRPVNISQVIVNLLTNSLHALERFEERWIQIECVEDPGDSQFVQLIVSDSGNGIPEKVVEKMFDPFFTTKPSYQGTGLGLSVSSSILREHGGELKYQLLNGHTGFILRLPKRQRKENSQEVA